MAKTKTKKKHERVIKTPFDYIKQTIYLNCAIIIIQLKNYYKWDDDKIAEFLEGYVSQIEEIHDKRASVWEYLRDCKELTGIDVPDLFGDMLK